LQVLRKKTGTMQQVDEGWKMEEPDEKEKVSNERERERERERTQMMRR
jgi:hypothetical protein